MIRKFPQRNVESGWILTPVLVKFILAGWTSDENRKVIKVHKIILWQNGRSKVNGKMLIFLRNGNAQLFSVYLDR